jgi:hypothetical protein
MKNITMGLLISVLSGLFGCNASITRHGYTINDLETNLEPCTNIIIKHKASFTEDVAPVVGRIEAADSGFSTACSEAYVLGIFRKDACVLNANIINITEETQPNFWSSCYRAKADLLRCKDKIALADIKSDPQYTAELISDRSAKTAIMNAAAFGVIGGVIGGAIGGAVVGGIAAAATPANVSDQNTSDWRLLVMSDLGDNSEWRKENDELYLTVKADFNADGENDAASLLINEKENKIGLFVTLTSNNNSPLILLESINDKQTIKGMGVRVALPGKYKTACGKGYGACKTDEPSEIEVKYPAIDLFQNEGANSFYIWESKENQFKRVWMSD